MVSTERPVVVISVGSTTPQQQPAQMFVDAMNICYGSRSKESQGRMSVDYSSGSGISHGLLCTYNFVIDDTQSTQRAALLVNST